jgi:hypothetical protein
VSGETSLVRERIERHRGQLLGFVAAGLDGVLDDDYVGRLLDEFSGLDGHDVAAAGAQLVVDLLDAFVAVTDLHPSDVVARRIALQRLALEVPLVPDRDGTGPGGGGVTQ